MKRVMNFLRGTLVKRFILLALLTVLFSIMSSLRSANTWQLTFNDEFDGAELNTEVWNTVPRTGRVDKKGEELQYYADDAFELKDGILRIKAEKRYMENRSYTSGLIDTRGKFLQKYGYFEIRAKLPSGQGFWPAFWLLQDGTWPPEIDVFENLGHQTNTIYLSNHWKNGNGTHEYITKKYLGPDYSKDFHTYAIEWNPSEIIWYIDGKEFYRTNQGVPSEPMFIIANLAVGGNWPGNPDSTTPFPSYLEIDFIRVYKRSSSGSFLNYLPTQLRP